MATVAQVLLLAICGAPRGLPPRALRFGRAAEGTNGVRVRWGSTTKGLAISGLCDGTQGDDQPIVTGRPLGGSNEVATAEPDDHTAVITHATVRAAPGADSYQDRALEDQAGTRSAGGPWRGFLQCRTRPQPSDSACATFANRLIQRLRID